MTYQTEKLAVMFSDISGSTALYDRLGDDLARGLITKCIALMLDKVNLHHGSLIKTIGDEIMCTFSHPENAVNAACAMQISVENDGRGEAHAMHIRIGIHFGDVISENGDVYGDTVNVAARVASITRASQIMTTLAVADSLPADLRAKTHKIMRAELKGKQEQLDIFQVDWETDDTLRTRVGMSAFRKPQQGNDELTLRYRGRSFKINEQNRNAVLGRDEVCDILVASDFASRQHARIELRFGKFVLIDQSTNGTFVQLSNGHLVRLSREDLVLHNAGAISLGLPHQDSPDDVVEFSIAAAI